MNGSGGVTSGGSSAGSHLSAYMDSSGSGGSHVDSRSLASFTDDFLPLPALPPPGSGPHHHIQQQVCHSS